MLLIDAKWGWFPHYSNSYLFSEIQMHFVGILKKKEKILIFSFSLWGKLGLLSHLLGQHWGKRVWRASTRPVCIAIIWAFSRRDSTHVYGHSLKFVALEPATLDINFDILDIFPIKSLSLKQKPECIKSKIMKRRILEELPMIKTATMEMTRNIISWGLI